MCSLSLFHLKNVLFNAKKEQGSLGRDWLTGQFILKVGDFIQATSIDLVNDHYKVLKDSGETFVVGFLEFGINWL